MSRFGLLSIGLLCALWLSACGGKRPENLGTSANGLAACPASPNCVSSDATDDEHAIAPFVLAVPIPEAWPIIREEVSNQPRTEIINASTGYLHAESTSALFRYIDDLELDARTAEGEIAVRSASRLGHSDMGVNRKRVETLREALRARGVIQ